MQKRKIIIDTDPGQDDAVAILLALASPEEIDLLGITVVAGNVPLDLTKKNARKQLNLISGKKVIFKTGICVIDTNTMKKLSSVVNYSIKMRKISKNTINNYIDKEDMLNCAASIRIEGLAISLIEKATGEDPTSVIGLPLITLITYLEKLGYKS